MSFWYFKYGFLYKNKGSGGCRKNPSYGLITGIPADVNNKFISGAGVGATNRSVYRAKKRHATVCTNSQKCGTFIMNLGQHPTKYQMQLSDEYPNITIQQFLLAKQKASEPNASAETKAAYYTLSAMLLNNYS
jgi:hypothetical protein